MTPELSRVLTLFRRFGKKSDGATIAVILWHWLGAPVDTALSFHDFCVLADFVAKVRKRRVINFQPENETSRDR
jgi:hypothetical protein